jgi:hypothetical protein
MKVPENLSYRDKIVREILQTERTFVKGLEVLVDRCMKPLLSRSLLTSRQVDEIFRNIEDLLKINKVLLFSMEDKILHDGWTNAKMGVVFTEVVSYNFVF